VLTILFNQPGPTPRFTGTYNVIKPAKLAPPRQRISLRGSAARMGYGVSTLGLAEPTEGIYADEGEEEELVLLMALMG